MLVHYHHSLFFLTSLLCLKLFLPVAIISLLCSPNCYFLSASFEWQNYNCHIHKSTHYSITLSKTSCMMKPMEFFHNLNFAIMFLSWLFFSPCMIFRSISILHTCWCNYAGSFSSQFVFSYIFVVSIFSPNCHFFSATVSKLLFLSATF